MRSLRRSFWTVIAIVVTIGVGANVLIACGPFPQFDPVGDLSWRSFHEGNAAADSLRFADAERCYRISAAVASIDHSQVWLRMYAMRGVATALWVQGRYAEATTMWHQVEQTAESEYGPGSERLIDPLADLARGYRSMGRDSLAEAAESKVESIVRSLEPTILRSVKSQQALLPTSSRVLADKLIELGDLYMKRHRADLAEIPYSHALELRDQTEAPLREGPFEARLRLARCSASLGKYTRAAAIYRYLLPRQEAAWPYSRDLLRIIEPLAGAEYYRGRYSAAESLFERCLRIREGPWGIRNLDLVQTLTMLARCRSAELHFDDALSAQSRAVDISRRAYGARHLSLGYCLMDLATLQKEAGRLEEARESSREAREIFTRLGFMPPRTCAVRIGTELVWWNYWDSPHLD